MRNELTDTGDAIVAQQDSHAPGENIDNLAERLIAAKLSSLRCKNHPGSRIANGVEAKTTCLPPGAPFHIQVLCLRLPFCQSELSFLRA